MPVPKPEISAWTSLLASTLSMRAFSTLRILPRIGRIAWVCGLRPRTAEPPAESPSTMNTSEMTGSLLWQSRSLPGRPPDSSRPLRRVASRALRAAIRAAAACTDLRTMSRPSLGWAPSQWPSSSVTARWTKPLTSELPSLVLVWPSNCGSPSLTESTAVRPSRMSSPVRFSSFSLSSFWPRANSLTSLVIAARKPSSWVPPSWVLMVLA